VSEFRYYIYQEDCLEVLRRAPDNYFDSMVTDPPAGISFMHREWDGDKGGRELTGLPG
jgi:DNA modification methylase